MFIINPDPYSLPCYRIGPFQTRDLGINHRLPDSDLIDEYFATRFRGKDYWYTHNGRAAIHQALSHYNLQADDIVSILTTSGNFYISSCVTHEIEKFCKWSRNILPETKVLFVNHEFGYPYKNLGKLKKYGIPIIEDCAGSFFSTDEKNEIGNIGDFVIYSFPKMFPLQIGGLLVSNSNIKKGSEEQVKGELLRHIKNVLSSQIGSKEIIINKRLLNYKYLRAKFRLLGLTERFSLQEGRIPGVFMFISKGHQINLASLKNYFYSHGVQCSVFYGEEVFFIPVHQALVEEDMDYFFEIANSYINTNNK